MYDGYYGKITSDVYTAAIQIRGDDDTCWDERVPLAEPPLIFGPEFPEDWFGDDVIAIREAAHAQAAKEYGEGGYALESVTLYLEERISRWRNGLAVKRQTLHPQWGFGSEVLTACQETN